MSNPTREIALYGKGGIGKSTIACNLSVNLSEMGHKVMQVGCNPKVDSTAFLLGGEPSDVNVLQHTKEYGVSEKTVLETVVEGYRAVLCVESGGPEPAEGCAGRGVTLALDLLKQYQIAERFNVDFIIYDVIADVVCGGFGQPMRSGYAREVYLVTSGELMSLYSANNISRAIATIAASGRDVRVAGIISNMRGVENELELIEAFAQRIGVPIMAHIPRDSTVQKAEALSGTVAQVFPDSPMGKLYRTLAEKVLEPKDRVVPTPMELEELLGLLRKYQVVA